MDNEKSFLLKANYVSAGDLFQGSFPVDDIPRSLRFDEQLPLRSDCDRRMRSGPPVATSAGGLQATLHLHHIVFEPSQQQSACENRPYQHAQLR
jgi:hypothetical protein